MKFSFDGSKVVCSRIASSDDGDMLRDVVEFDAHVDAIPMHVATQLTKMERLELERFLEDKERILARPDHSVILEALPALIDKVRGVLVSVERIDEHVFQQLTTANERLGAALIDVAVNARDSNTQLNEMSESEALKPRLDVIKRGL